MTSPEIRARFVAGALSKLSHSSRALTPRDIELLMLKGAGLTRQVISAWEQHEGKTTLIYQPDAEEVSTFIVKELLSAFSHFTKDEMLHILVLGHAQQLVEEIAGTTNLINKVKI